MKGIGLSSLRPLLTAASLEWRAANKERIAENQKVYREENQEHIKASKAAYAKANSAALVEKVRQLRLKDPEVTKAKRAAEYQKRKARASELAKQDRINNPEKHKAQSHKYRTEHLEEIKAKKAQIVVCECGAQLTYSTLTRHRKTDKHLALLSATNSYHSQYSTSKR